MINIGGKEYELIDAHFHVFEKMHGFRHKDVPMAPIGNGRVNVGGEIIQFMSAAFADGSSPFSSLEVEMENNHVDKGVLLQTPVYGVQYEFMDKIIKANPGRFVTSGVALPYDEAEYRRQAKIAFEKWNCKGLKFEMPDTPFVADSNDSDFIFETILEYGKYMIVDLGWGSTAMDYPIEAYKKAVTKYKDLTFVFPHLGVSRLWDPKEAPDFDSLKNTLSLLDLSDNVWFDIAGMPMLTGEFEEYPFLTANAAIKVVKEMTGMHHIMFGTDYPGITPYCTYKQSIDQIKVHCDFLNDSEKVKLFYANAQQLWFS